MDKKIKDRIDAIRQGSFDDQYAKTEIGILPRNWRVARLSDIAEKLTQTTGTDSYETVSISAGIGFVNQVEKFGKEISGKQYEKYIVLHKGDFSYNKGNSNKYPQGCIYRLKDRETAAVPNVFESFKIQNECAEFYDHLFVSGFLNRQLSKKINHGIRDDGLLNLTEKDFYSCLLPVPPLAEQEKISEILDHYDEIIKLCEAKTNEYKSLKKTCLSKMFPQNGNITPEIRVPGFVDAWEQRKLGEIMDVASVKRIHQSDWTKEGVRFLRARDIVSDFKNEEPEDYLYISKDKYDEYSAISGKVAIDDLLVTGVGTIGVPYLVRNLEPLYFKDGNIIWFKNNGKVNGYFLYYSFIGNTIQSFIKNSAGTGTVGTYTIENGKKTPIFCPTFAEQNKIGNYFSKLDHLITLHQREVEEYSKLKKAMAQLLLSGIVRIKT